MSPASTPLAITVLPIPDLPVITPSNSEICPCASVMLTTVGCGETLSWFETSDAATSVGSNATLGVTNGLTASFDTDGRDGEVTPDTRQVWVIENIPSNQAFTVNVTENGCGTSTNFTAPDCGTAAPLPVDLLWFKGDIADEKVTINWLTANEVGIQQFEIEKSRDAVNFSRIGEVTAKNDTENQLYSFDDFNPILGVNYYRLRIKEFDIDDSFSKIIALDFSKRAEFQWKLFPNPFDIELNYITIETNGKAAIKSVDLYSISGSRLQTKLEEVNANSYRLNIGRLPASTYLIQLRTDAGFFTKKFVITK